MIFHFFCFCHFEKIEFPFQTNFMIEKFGNDKVLNKINNKYKLLMKSNNSYIIKNRFKDESKGTKFDR